MITERGILQSYFTCGQFSQTIICNYYCNFCGQFFANSVLQTALFPTIFADNVMYLQAVFADSVCEQCFVNSALRTVFCGQCYGQCFADIVLRTVFCGRCFADSVTDSVLRTVTVLWTVFCGQFFSSFCRKFLWTFCKMFLRAVLFPVFANVFLKDSFLRKVFVDSLFASVFLYKFILQSHFTIFITAHTIFLVYLHHSVQQVKTSFPAN